MKLRRIPANFTGSLDDHQMICAFSQGQARGRHRDGYLADNPHAYGSEAWRVWREGYFYERPYEVPAA